MSPNRTTPVACHPPTSLPGPSPETPADPTDPNPTARCATKTPCTNDEPTPTPCDASGPAESEATSTRSDSPTAPAGSTAPCQLAMTEVAVEAARIEVELYEIPSGCPTWPPGSACSSSGWLSGESPASAGDGTECESHAGEAAPGSPAAKVAGSPVGRDLRSEYSERLSVRVCDGRIA